MFPIALVLFWGTVLLIIVRSLGKRARAGRRPGSGSNSSGGGGFFAAGDGGGGGDSGGGGGC
ncbi:hypothetical protein ACFV5N_03805 [Streptomyces sp. NPDC059853]|uniref:hypothetical protein n=1 Tax=Streptomyces sp. NPDC059853 TaxID=3346973 RepID=UPI00364A51B7